MPGKGLGIVIECGLGLGRLCEVYDKLYIVCTKSIYLFKISLTCKNKVLFFFNTLLISICFTDLS